MPSPSAPQISLLAAAGILCRGEGRELAEWLRGPVRERIGCCALLILTGCAAYGFTLGLWRAPVMGLFVGVKLPLLVFLTLAVNGMLNAVLAQVLGSGLRFSETLLSILMSFAVFSVIAGALSPITLFFVLDAPSPGAAGASEMHSTWLLVHTFIIAFAGITANLRLYPLLQAATGEPAVARRVFFSWLAGNLFVGAQLSWNLRPFFGLPGRPVEIIRPDWNRSSFYENVFQHLFALLSRAADSPEEILLAKVLAAALPILLCAAVLLILLRAPLPGPRRHDPSATAPPDL